MNLYLANGRYVGTQAEARRADRNFRPVTVPVDKDGLIAYLNGLAPAPAPSSAAAPPAAAEHPVPHDLRHQTRHERMSAGAVLASMENPDLDVDGIVTTILESRGHTLRRFAGAVALAFTKLGGQGA